MKKLFLILGLLMLGACNPLVDNAASCGESGTTQSTWNGLSFELPACWSSTPSGEDLVLVNEDETNTILLTLTRPETVELTATLSWRQNASDETVFVLISDLSDPEAEEVLISLTTEKIENDNEGACDVPDSTYVAAYTETWQNVQYSLPRCWRAKDNTSNLWLKEDESESYVRMTFSSEENEEMNKSSKEFQAPDGETLYLYFRTKDFEDSQVQDILYSIQFITP